MRIDATTLTDLEIFQSPDGSEGLLGLIDGTRTSGGRKALYHRLSHPSSDAATLRRVQDAVQFFGDHPELFVVDGASFDAVEDYLDSNIEVSSTGTLADRAELVWVSLRYRDLLREVREGVGATLRFFGTVDRVIRGIDAATPPPLVAGLVATVRAVAARVRARGSGGTVLRQDRAFRLELRGEVARALAAVAELDALAAMGARTAELGWTLPELVVSENFLLEADDVVHPFVDTPVSNPVRLSGGEPMVFLTGPNMAGKTTYLRTVALLTYLAQVGMGVPASRARLTPVEALFTSLNPSDNLKAGVSYFLAEILRVKEAATLLAEGRRCLVLFDEVFKGTNVKDALEASSQVILGFARARSSGFIFSSHLTELVDELASDPSIRFCSFDGQIVEGAPRFNYRLKEGVSDQRFGVLLLREAHIPELIARISA